MRRLEMPIGMNWCHVQVWVDGPNRSLREVTFPISEDHARTYGISTTITPSATKRWAQYEATLFGVGLHPDAPVTGDPGRLWPCVIPDFGIAAVQLWRMTARHGQSPVRAEWRWHPQYGVEATISGPVDAPHCQDEVERARQGFALLLSLKNEGGRDRLAEAKDTAWIELTKRAIDYKARTGCTWMAAARHVRISVRQLTTWRDELRKLPKTADFSP